MDGPGVFPCVGGVFVAQADINPHMKTERDIGERSERHVTGPVQQLCNVRATRAQGIGERNISCELTGAVNSHERLAKVPREFRRGFRRQAKQPRETYLMEKLLTINELASVLGVTAKGIRRRLERGSPSVPVPLLVPGSTRLRWRQSDVEAWLAALPVRATGRKPPRSRTSRELPLTGEATIWEKYKGL